MSSGNWQPSCLGPNVLSFLDMMIVNQLVYKQTDGMATSFHHAGLSLLVSESILHMMTSSNANIPALTGPLWGDSNPPVTGEFPTQRPVTRNSDCFIIIICAWINDWVNKGEADDLRRHGAHHEECRALFLWWDETLFKLTQWSRFWLVCWHNMPHFKTVSLCKTNWTPGGRPLQMPRVCSIRYCKNAIGQFVSDQKGWELERPHSLISPRHFYFW